MGNFSVSSDLFSDYDDLYFQDLKKKKAEDILKRKEAAIQSLTSGVSDADNSVLNGINTRQGAPNVTLDTGETPKGFTLPYAEGREGVRDKHARTLASELGYHPSQITDEMLYQKGLESQAYSEELKLEGQPDPENPQLQVTEHGKDKYGRPITEVVNPYTGVNINRALNTSEHNLDFYSKYNKYDQANYAEKGDDKLPNFVIDQNEDGTYNFHVRGGLKNPNIEDPERERTVIRRTVPTDIFGFHDEERKEGGRYDTFSRNNLSENDLAHWVNAFKGVSQLDTESAGGKFKFSGHVPEEVLMEEQDFLEGAQRIALSGYEEVYRLLKKAGKLSVKEVLNYVTLSPLENSLEIESPLAKDIPKELTLAQAFELMPDSAALIEKAKLADTYAKEALTLLTTPEEKFRAAKSAELDLIEFVENLYSDRKGEGFSMLADSAALMYEISKGLPGMGVAIVSTQDRMLEGFINENGREPIKEEQAWLWGLATVSVAGETLGFKGLVGKFKGLNTWLTRATAKSPAFGRFLAKILAGGTVGLVAEGSSGVISGTAEHMGIHIADGVKFPTLTEQREAFWLEAMPGHLTATAVSGVAGAATSHDAAVLEKIKQQLVDGQAKQTLTVDEETVIHKKIEALDAKLRHSDLAKDHRTRLATKRDELFQQTLQGKDNKNALTTEQRESLTKTANELEARIEASTSVQDKLKAIGSFFTKKVDEKPQKQVFKGTTEEFEDIKNKLNTTEDLDITTHQELLGALTDSANAHIDAWMKTDVNNTEAVEQAKKKAGEALNEVKAQQAKYESREDFRNSQADLVLDEKKAKYVYNLDKTDTKDADDINAFLTSNESDLTPHEVDILHAKLDVISTKKELEETAKNLETVHQDIVGTEGAPDVSKDFVSFEKYRQDIIEGRNYQSDVSKLIEFADYMQHKAKVLKSLYAKVARGNTTEHVEITTPAGNTSTFYAHKGSGSFVDYVQQEAAYGQRIVALINSIGNPEHQTKQAVVPAQDAQNQRHKSNQLRQKIFELESKVTEETTDTAESTSEQTESVEDGSNDLNEILLQKRQAQKGETKPKKEVKVTPEKLNELLNPVDEAKKDTKEIPAKDSKDAGTESDTKSKTVNTSTTEAKEVKSTEETQTQKDLFGDSTNEVKDAFTKAGVLTKLGTVYAEGSLSLDQWKTAAKKLGVLPDGC